LGASALALEKHNAAITSLTTAIALASASDSMASFIATDNNNNIGNVVPKSIETNTNTSSTSSQGKNAIMRDSYMMRATAKFHLSDLKGALEDATKAQDLCSDPTTTTTNPTNLQRSKALRSDVVVAMVQKKKKLAEELKKQPVHNYGTAIIQEIPEELSLVEERVELQVKKLEEQGRKDAFEAQRKATKMLQRYMQEAKAVREENAAREKRNDARKERKYAAASAASINSNSNNDSNSDSRIYIPVKIQETSDDEVSNASTWEEEEDRGNTTSAAAAGTNDAAIDTLSAQLASGAIISNNSNKTKSTSPTSILNGTTSITSTTPTAEELKAAAEKAVAKKDHPTAEALYAHYISLEPNDQRAYSNRCQSRLDAGDPRGALEDIDHALEMKAPLISHAAPLWRLHLRKAAALQALGRAHAAVEELEKAQSIESAVEEENDGGGSRRSGEKVGASTKTLLAKKLQILLESIEQSTLLREEGNNLFKKGDYDGALRKYSAALEFNGGDKFAHANAAAALLKMERWEAAAEAAREALKIDPGFDKAQYRLDQAEGMLVRDNPLMANNVLFD
jgi:tetratricopeptide (TPR) repeat protein